MFNDKKRSPKLIRTINVRFNNWDKAERVRRNFTEWLDDMGIKMLGSSWQTLDFGDGYILTVKFVSTSMVHDMALNELRRMTENGSN